MGTFAASTSVSSEKSRAEIERILQRYGATGFLYGWDADQAVLGFVVADRQVKFILPMPDRNAREFWRTPSKGLHRTPAQAAEAFDQAVRQRWRALALVIKAKLEAVESGITTFEDEFLAHIVLPNGSTVGQWVHPQLAFVYSEGKMPALMPGVGDG